MCLQSKLWLQSSENHITVVILELEKKKNVCDKRKQHIPKKTHSWTQRACIICFSYKERHAVKIYSHIIGMYSESVGTSQFHYIGKMN